VARRWKHKIATRKSAMLTAYLESGQNGPSVTNNVTLACKKEADLSKSHKVGTGQFARPPLKFRSATRTSVTLTAKWDSGASGQNAARLADMDTREDPGSLRSNKRAMELNASQNWIPSIATSKSVLLIAWWEPGRNGKNGQLAANPVAVASSTD